MPTKQHSAKHRQVGRPREFDMDEVLDAAVDVFRTRGYSATSIADLGTATGLTAGSLYKAFPDKRAIFESALDRYLDQRNAALARWLASAKTGREKVLAMLLSYAEVSYGKNGRRGCLILKGLTEVDTFDAQLAHRFHEALTAVQQRFADFVEAGVLDQSLSRELDVAATARFLVCVVEGMRVLGKHGATHAEVKAVAEQTVRALT